MNEYTESDEDEFPDYLWPEGNLESSALQALEESGFFIIAGGLIVGPDREILPNEWKDVNYLCEEWDYGYEPHPNQLDPNPITDALRQGIRFLVDSSIAMHEKRDADGVKACQDYLATASDDRYRAKALDMLEAFQLNLTLQI